MHILHIAPFNTAGVPMTFVLAERRLGHTSHLITLGRDKQNRPSDICLNLPFLDSRIIRFVKNRVTAPSRLNITYSAPVPASVPIQWTPSNRREALLIQMREELWK